MSAQIAIFLDGKPVSALPLPDRGLEFGDGVFETILLRAGIPAFPDPHLARLAQGLQVLGFPDCAARARHELATACAAARDAGWRWGALRLTVTRGAGPRGYAPPLEPRPRIIIQVTELTRDYNRIMAPATLCLADVSVACQPRLAGIKHLNRLEQVLAAQQALQAGTDAALMLDTRGRVNCVSSGNLFLVRGRELLTPALDQGGIAGTRRGLILARWAQQAGLEPVVAELAPEDVRDCDELLFSNSLVGVRPVGRFEDCHWGAHPVSEQLFRAHLEELP